MANEEKLNLFYGATHAKICQAVAVLMMVYHHIFSVAGGKDSKDTLAEEIRVIRG